MGKSPAIKKSRLRFSSPLQRLPRVQKLIYHHMSRSNWGLQDVHEFHKKKGWKGIGYNYWISYDGTIYEARGESIGAHVRGWNDKSLGIGFQGDFDFQPMLEEQMQSGVWLTAYLMKKYGLRAKDVVGHKDLTPTTTCPGAHFPMNEMKQRAVSLLSQYKK